MLHFVQHDDKRYQHDDKGISSTGGIMGVGLILLSFNPHESAESDINEA